MPRPYGTLSDDELHAEMGLRKKQLADNKQAQIAHDAKRSEQTELAHAHMALLLSREGAAISKDMVSISVEISLREEGTWKRIQ